MEYKHVWIVDTHGNYVDAIRMDLLPQYKNGDLSKPEMVWTPYAYAMQSGEQIVAVQPPGLRQNAGDTGIVKLRWDGSAWVEGATKQEIAAWEAAHPNPNTLAHLRAETLGAISSACNAAIVAGCDATLSGGSTGHFALQDTDQINLSAAVSAIQQGAAGYPYHADGELCRLFPAADILAVAAAAMAHKLYHTTYCNHLLTWARRAGSIDELAGITYGAALPADLAENMQEVLAGAQVDEKERGA